VGQYELTVSEGEFKQFVQLGETLRWLGRLPEAREQYAAAAEKKKAATEASRLLRRVIAPASAN
jgi:hypothetical protein